MNSIINTFLPISLSEMNGVKLLNRTDTKFVTTIDKLRLLLAMARGDYFAQEIDGSRIAPYYTVYFDTPDQAMYNVHQDGYARRQKLRIRSYVDSHLNYLEIKTKNNHGRTKKKRISLSGFDPCHPSYDIRFNSTDASCVSALNFLKQNLEYMPESLSEQLENRFERITLVNKAKTERLTIDSHLKFHNLLTGRCCSLDNLVIIELKRDGLQPSPILEMLRQLHIHPMGFSKYVMGAAMTNPQLKQNRLKPRIRQVMKLQQQGNLKYAI